MDGNAPDVKEAIAAAYCLGATEMINSFGNAILTGQLPPGVTETVCTGPCERPTPDAPEGVHALCLVSRACLDIHDAIHAGRADAWATANPMIAKQVSEAMDKAEGMDKADGAG